MFSLLCPYTCKMYTHDMLKNNQKWPLQKDLWLFVEQKKNLLGEGGRDGCIISSLHSFVSYVAHWGDAERDFHLHLFSISWGHGRGRLTSHNISNHITCDHSNAVIILGPYSFPSNECKSTPSPLASDGSWQEDVTSTVVVSLNLVLSLHFQRCFFFFFLNLPSL